MKERMKIRTKLHAVKDTRLHTAVTRVTQSALADINAVSLEPGVGGLDGHREGIQSK